MEAFTLTAHAAQMARERCIDQSWILLALLNPAMILPDPRDKVLIHKFRRIPDYGGRVLRIVIDSTQIPPRVITLFFDSKASREMP